MVDLGSSSPTISPLVHDENAVRHVHDLVQLQRDEQHGLARVALGDKLLVDVLDRADVQTARGLHGDEQLGCLSISRATMAFCWLPPDILRAVVAGLARAHVVLLDQPLSVGADVRRRRKPALSVNSGSK